MRIYILVCRDGNYGGSDIVSGLTTDVNVLRAWLRDEGWPSGRGFYVSADYLETEFGANKVHEWFKDEDRQIKLEEQ